MRGTALKKTYKAQYPDDPPCCWLVYPDGSLLFPAFLFCTEECRGLWTSVQVRYPLGKSLGRLPYRLVPPDPRCTHCRKRIWRNEHEKER